MSEQEKLERGKRRTKRLMITITVAFLVLMLVIPLASVIASSLKEGIGFYLESISTEYVRSALGVTILATVIAVIVNTFFGNFPFTGNRSWRRSLTFRFRYRR